MIRLQCPRCKTDIAPLSSAWQSQRQTDDKFCPHCQAPVKVGIDRSRFLQLGALFAIPGALFFWLLPSQEPWMAAALGAVTGASIALLPSLRLQAREPQNPTSATARGRAAAVPRPRAPSRRWLRHGLGLLVLVLLLKIASDYSVTGARELKLHLTATERPVATLDFQSLNGQEDEASLRTRFASLTWSCYGKLPNTLGERNCYADVSAVNGIEAMVLAMHFNQGRLKHAVVQYPPWRWRAMRRWMLDTMGLPSAGQSEPVQGVRLVGWRLPNGHALVLNRDQSWNLFEPSALMWSRSDACGNRPCFPEAGSEPLQKP